MRRDHQHGEGHQERGERQRQLGEQDPPPQGRWAKCGAGRLDGAAVAVLLDALVIFPVSPRFQV
ncbi:hypothetical protein CFK39_06360 [Brachybacterium avium]|uniref:Uncharacterized protein n=1 Tax=Brachybacterium avium TaxID=2017485 RepID=A0A220UBM2_9MICO|nr:hypothetical protein CFK39_06360 [Brachybacterium avium]